MMERIKIWDKYFKPYLPYEELTKSIDSVAEALNADFEGGEDVPVLLCVLNGAVMFTGEIMKRIRFDCELTSIKISSYQGTQSTGQVKVSSGINGDVRGKKVIICEDIVDAGNSIEFLCDYLKDLGATEVRICTMLYKPGSYNKSIKIDYIGRSIPNDFIVGFGLDYDERGRALKDIYVLDE
ncbi:MAG: hypoxanthine phosphoribosyltransferase [Bacteroidales bacterium]|nr:hypoxanthine phosphoribosyltransferase [Bacteroidales bacterium]